MGAILPVIIWVTSAIICHLIARQRNVRVNHFRTMLIVVLGPLAIPLAFFFKPES